MPTIEIDVDLDQFETDDLIKELKDRSIPVNFYGKIDTLEKQMMYDFFMENIEKISPQKLETNCFR